MIFTDTASIIESLGRNTPTWTYTTQQYAHRNGETAPPTEPGKYWFVCDKWRDTVDVIPSASMLMAFDPHTNRYYDVRDSRMSGQWWGPVVAPWEQGA